jgi:hypothetical protein
MDKAHLLIDANSSRVCRKRGKERYTALGVNVARDCGDKSLSIAAASEVRVCADGTHFREAGRGQSLTSHCSVGCCSRACVCLDRRSETQIFVDPGAFCRYRSTHPTLSRSSAEVHVKNG